MKPIKRRITISTRKGRNITGEALAHEMLMLLEDVILTESVEKFTFVDAARLRDMSRNLHARLIDNNVAKKILLPPDTEKDEEEV